MEVIEYFSEASEFHQVWRMEGYTKPEKALIGMVFFSSRRLLIYPYEGPTLSIANIERWILKSAIIAQKEQTAKQSVTLTITSLIDQDIVTFTPLLARGQAFTLGIGGSFTADVLPLAFKEASMPAPLKDFMLQRLFKH